MGLIELLLVLLMAFTSTTNAYCIKNRTPAELDEFNTQTVRAFAILIDNSEDGAISIIKPGKITEIGAVVRPAFQAERAPDLFWAYHYCGGQNGSKGAVVGAGVNTIDIRCGPNRSYDPQRPNNWLASVISVIPFTEEENATPNDIVVTCPGGSDIFNKWSPFVGNPVYAMDGEEWISIDSYFTSPTRNAPRMILIDVRKPKLYLPYIEFENWIRGDTIKGETMTDDGGVWILNQHGEKNKIARVLQRLESTGLFTGSEYAEVGQVRINTPGLLEISTNRWRGRIEDPNDRGGVEILADNDAKYLHYNLGYQSIIGGKPYMIIGSLDSQPSDLANPVYTDDNGLLIKPTMGSPPFFNGFIRPHYEIDNFESSFRVFISEDFGRTWRAIPEITGTAQPGEISPVHYWTNIRLMMGR